MLPTGLVLIVEDEPLIAMSIEECVRDIGLTPATAAGLDCALALANEADLTVAVLDVSMQKQGSEAVADILKARGIPFVVSTGSQLIGCLARFKARPSSPSPIPMTTSANCSRAYSRQLQE